MKYLLKLNQHIKHAENIIYGDCILCDKDGNRVEIDELPDYILEADRPYFYLYPKHLDLFKDSFITMICNYCDVEYIMKHIIEDEDVEILKATVYSGKRIKKRMKMLV